MRPADCVEAFGSVFFVDFVISEASGIFSDFSVVTPIYETEKGAHPGILLCR